MTKLQRLIAERRRLTSKLSTLRTEVTAERNRIEADIPRCPRIVQYRGANKDRTFQCSGRGAYDGFCYTHSKAYKKPLFPPAGVSLCGAVKTNGEQCRGAGKFDGLCWWHERQQRYQRGGTHSAGTLAAEREDKETLVPRAQSTVTYHYPISRADGTYSRSRLRDATD